MNVHHLGFVTADVDAALDELNRGLGGVETSGRGVDPRQGAEIVLAYGSGGLLYELLRPTSEKSPIAAALRNGGGLHHVGYGVPDVRAAAAAVRDKGGILVVGPVAAVAFNGLEVAFAYFRNLGLVEYVDERAGPPFFRSPPPAL
jgi:methylmalonyl-CoA/ethylmalonyl-CoA epimerase